LAMLLSALLCVGAGLLVRFVLPRYLVGYIQHRSEQIIRERFDADVHFGQFDVSLIFPRLAIRGGDVTVRKVPAVDPLPLISVQSFTVNGGLLQFLRSPAHVTSVELHGMAIHVPARGEEEERRKTPRTARQHYPVVVDTLICTDCEVEIMPKRADKEPLHFAIHRLEMQNVGLGRSAPYRASLTNAVPRGEIQTSGHFGPWQPESPSTTTLAGTYVFRNANLDPFPGIAGTLDSTGKFEGQLDHIVADGETDTPDFALDTAGHALPLRTQFHAIIDGTSGDTTLDPVNAQLASSSILASGGVFGTPGRKGRAVILEVTVSPGRLEDLLRLGVKSSRPPMIGGVRFHTHLEIPPGKGTVSSRLKLNGRFLATGAEPTNPKLQRKLESLSRRAEGKPKDPNAGTDKFNLEGRFILDAGVARLPHVTFTMPGASLKLGGRYALHSEKLAFSGELRLAAKLSQTTTGIKSLLLKTIDPLFKGTGAGAVLPISISGTRAHPSFHLQLLGPSAPKEAHQDARP
jgi:hypothetical protein